ADDLADAGPQRIGEHGRVDSKPNEDDAQRGPLQPHPLRELVGTRGLDRRSKDDHPDGRVLLKLLDETLDGGYDGALRPDRRRQRVDRGPVDLDKNRLHQVPQGIVRQRKSVSADTSVPASTVEFWLRSPR